MHFLYKETTQILGLLLINIIVLFTLYHFFLKYLSNTKGYISSFLLIFVLVLTDFFAYSTSATTNKVKVEKGSIKYIENCFTLLTNEEISINKKSVLYHLLDNFKDSETLITLKEKVVLHTLSEAISITRPVRRLSIKEYASGILDQKLNEKIKVEVMERNEFGKIINLELSKVTIY